jgi:hypothetical protein
VVPHGSAAKKTIGWPSEPFRLRRVLHSRQPSPDPPRSRGCLTFELESSASPEAGFFIFMIRAEAGGLRRGGRFFDLGLRSVLNWRQPRIGHLQKLLFQCRVRGFLCVRAQLRGLTLSKSEQIVFHASQPVMRPILANSESI